MKYYHNLYMSDNIKNHKESIIYRLDKQKTQLNKYLIVLSENTENHLEFFDSVLLKQKIFSSKELFVIGIADGYDCALELVETITKDVYEKTQGTNIRRYLLDTQKEFEESIG